MGTGALGGIVLGLVLLALGVWQLVPDMARRRVLAQAPGGSDGQPEQ